MGSRGFPVNYNNFLTTSLRACSYENLPHAPLWRSDWPLPRRPHAPQISALKSYDLATGAPRASYPMPEDDYCNDLVQGKSGNLYVTDSLYPRILRLAPGKAALQCGKRIQRFPPATSIS